MTSDAAKEDENGGMRWVPYKIEDLSEAERSILAFPFALFDLMVPLNGLALAPFGKVAVTLTGPDP
jgi:hypothetical protein